MFLLSQNGDFFFFSLLQNVPSWESFEQIQAVGRNCDLHYFRESVCWNGVGMFCYAVTHFLKFTFFLSQAVPDGDGVLDYKYNNNNNNSLKSHNCLNPGPSLLLIIPPFSPHPPDLISLIPPFSFTALWAMEGLIVPINTTLFYSFIAQLAIKYCVLK